MAADFEAKYSGNVNIGYFSFEIIMSPPPNWG